MGSGAPGRPHRGWQPPRAVHLGLRVRLRPGQPARHLEPVCTHPDHQRRGPGKALMQEGLLRLQARGAVDVTVETGDMVPANRLYESIGFTEAYRGFEWRKAYWPT
ncbi:MAG: GNAT family N-acetyltransferase [Anaerolineae bacterium]